MVSGPPEREERRLRGRTLLCRPLEPLLGVVIPRAQARSRVRESRRAGPAEVPRRFGRRPCFWRRRTEEDVRAAPAPECVAAGRPQRVRLPCPDRRPILHDRFEVGVTGEPEFADGGGDESGRGGGAADEASVGGGIVGDGGGVLGVDEGGAGAIGGRGDRGGWSKLI